MAAIKRAYRTLAKQYHPDRVPINRRGWARAHMARVNAAYEVLSDPQRRDRYDRQRDYAPIADDQPPPPSGRGLWRVQRVRERSRRQRMERWRLITVISAAIAMIGTIATIFYARTMLGYMISALVNGSAWVLFLIGLWMMNH
jgi:curved DNA-binding protein CbpA